MKSVILVLSVALLTACALTPEQQAARAAAQKRYEQNLQVALAAQCSPEAAEIMRRQFDGNTGSTEQEQRAFRLAYLEAINDKVFQACYKMAWQNHIAHQELAELRYRYDYDDWWDYGTRPWGWRRW